LTKVTEHSMRVQYLVQKCCMSWGSQLYEDGVYINCGLHLHIADCSWILNCIHSLWTAVL